MMIVCVIYKADLIRMPDTDEHAIPRLLVAKGFRHTGGPLLPKLSGTITVDFNERLQRYKVTQTDLTDKVNNDD